MDHPHCMFLSKWNLDDISYDGEPRKAARFPRECEKCIELGECAAKVKFAWTMDQFVTAMSLEVK